MQYKVSEAVRNFKTGNYEAALAAFLAAAEMYGEKHFAYNIKLCKQRLHATQSFNVSINKGFVNEYFDHVYLVNLPRHTERRIKSVMHLRKAGIDFELYVATDGYQGAARSTYDSYLERGLGNLTRYQDFNEHERRRAKPYIESAGAVGYIYTYLSILHDAKRRGYKRFLILEDDVILCRDFEVRLRDFVSKIDPNWKVLQLGASQYGWDSVDEVEARITGYYHPRRLDTCGSFAIAFDQSVIDEVIAAESAFDAPFDHLPMGEIYERHLKQCYVAFPNLVMPDVSESSIRGARCQLNHSAKMKWVINDFDYPLRKPSVALFLSGKENARYIPHFHKLADMPFELRVFYHTKDGPRPVHDFTILESITDYLPPPDDLLFPSVDFCLVAAAPEVRLTDFDLISYIEQQIGLRPQRQTPLVSVNYRVNPVVPGRVSTIIPTYKRPDNLRNAIISVLTQDYENLEVIVVSDNGDASEFNFETQRIVKEIQEQYPTRIVTLVEHSINRNGAAARNTGILRSSGEFICFLDDDDIYLPGRLSQVIAKLRSTHKNVGAAYCGFLGWNSPANDLTRYAEGNLSLEILQLNYKKHYLHTNTATYRREAVLAINGFDESYRRHQDLEFNLRFFETFEIVAVKDALVQLNPSPSTISNKIYNRSMLDLKIKFLKQFDATISSFGAEIAREIYLKHWHEVVRYIHDKEGFLIALLKDYKNGPMMTISLLEHRKS